MPPTARRRISSYRPSATGRCREAALPQTSPRQNIRTRGHRRVGRPAVADVASRGAPLRRATVIDVAQPVADNHRPRAVFAGFSGCATLAGGDLGFAARPAACDSRRPPYCRSRVAPVLPTHARDRRLDGCQDTSVAAASVSGFWRSGPPPGAARSSNSSNVGALPADVRAIIFLQRLPRNDDRQRLRLHQLRAGRPPGRC